MFFDNLLKIWVGHYLTTFSSTPADGLAAQRQQLQAPHSTSVPHPLPVPEGSGEIQKVSFVIDHPKCPFV